MNFCSKCSKIIRIIKQCKKCKKLFCSESCLGYHNYSYHFNEQYSNRTNDINIAKDNNNNNNNFLEISNAFSSPYLTKGKMMLGKVIYDHTYSLKNFSPVIENGNEKIIGKGAYGKVFLAKNKVDNKLYAIKHMKKKDLYKALKTLKGIYTEIDIQTRITHPNIVKLLYVKENDDTFDLVMEYAKYGNLFYYIKKKNYLSEEKTFTFFIQVVNAIYFLHKNDLIHRDIKPENILMFEDGVVKLCDFGWCARLDGGQRITFCGTVEYMSPEMVNKEHYNKEIDIWSLGILLYEMIHGHSPFKPNKPKFNMYDVISNIKIQNLKFNKDISQDCKELIIHLLDRDISKRYKIEDIFNSKFVKYYENKNNNKNLILNNIDNNDSNQINIAFFKNIGNNYNNQLNEIKSNLYYNIEKEKENQKLKQKVKNSKNNTARNFYTNPLGNKEKENIEHIKSGSHCKKKKTIKNFKKNELIIPRYISQENLNNFFKKPNVKEKEKKKKNNAFSNADSELKDNEMKIQSITRNLSQNENVIKNIQNQPLTYRKNKYVTYNAKNKQIEQKNNPNLIKEKIREANEINNFDNNMNYTNREKIKKTKNRFNSCENYMQKNIYIEENKSGPLITEINDININQHRKYNSKVKNKVLQTEGNNPDEQKMINNFIDKIYTGKRNTKVKSNYRTINKKENKSLNNYFNCNNNTSSAAQINIINNNRYIYNNNIVKYSTFISNNMINTKSNKEGNKNIIRNFVKNKSSHNNSIFALFPHNKDNKIQNIKIQINEGQHYFKDENTMQDLDETPKKDIDNLKILPHELLNNFTKELKGYLK